MKIITAVWSDKLIQFNRGYVCMNHNRDIKVTKQLLSGFKLLL